MELREELPGDFDGIRELNRLAFDGDDEGRLVDALRADGLTIASLVAIIDGKLAGHVLFSRLWIETGEGNCLAASLAPMAVQPGMQRSGIGSALARRGIEICRDRGYTIALVVGHPGYYPRFGFSAEKARTLSSPYEGPAFMALELTPGALEGVAGTVKYPAAFSMFD